ncbi:MAG: hypothetical protein MUF87_20330 [Anaerolineae bacterium]|nr:hypothetical protein [Anaerolineae bacterium]
MGIRFFWDNPQHTVMRIVYEGVLVAQDYYEAVELVNALIQAESHRVCIIDDRHAVKSDPVNMLQLLQKLQHATPSNFGIRVLIGISPVTQMLLKIGHMMVPSVVERIFSAHSESEAYALIDLYFNAEVLASEQQIHPF